MNKEDSIMEVMELVDCVEELANDWQICVEFGANPTAIEDQLKDARSNIESKLRELLS